MKDEDKTKEQLINELVEMRGRINNIFYSQEKVTKTKERLGKKCTEFGGGFLGGKVQRN